MTELFLDLTPQMEYTDRKALLKASGDNEFYEKRQLQLSKTTTVYVGGLGFYTTEEQVEQCFASCGPIADVIMGLHRTERTPCGFCFVQYVHQASAIAAVNNLSGAIVDDRRIRVDFDVGDARLHNRFWARGATGGQVADEYRQNLDLGRGGLGTNRAQAGERSVLQNLQTTYSWIPPPPMKKQRNVKRPRE
jgi:nuclear cap-binding protein subunit 2